MKSVRRTQEILPIDQPVSESAIRVVLISDTHDCELTKLNLPTGDVLIHAGDFSRDGGKGQIKDFNKQLGEISHLFRRIIVIAGNHDIGLDTDPELKGLFTNCTYLEDESLSLCGYNLYGSPW